MIEQGIYEGKESGTIYDRRIFPSDWRYSAAIVGLIRFFDSVEEPYEMAKTCLYYNGESLLDDEKYATFIEKTYGEILHHISLEEELEKDNYTDDDQKRIKEYLKANSIMKKCFKDVKKIDKDVIIQIISENRVILTLDTFKNAKSGYAKFCNPNKFRSEPGKICRLNGYYEDTGRKTKSLGFNFDHSARVFNDCIEFDFIPFAFTTNRESIFINNNLTIENIVDANRTLRDDMKDLNQVSANIKERQKSISKIDKALADNFRSLIFYQIAEGASFIDYDSEVIMKDMSKDHFETLFIRKESIDLFKRIIHLDANKPTDEQYIKMALGRRIKITDNFYLNIMNEVTDAVLNLAFLDDLIIYLMRMNPVTNGFLVSQLININKLIYDYSYEGGDGMEHMQSVKRENYLLAQSINVKDSVGKVKQEFKKRNMTHKLSNYQAKLISALSARDNRRVYDIMLQLSAYAKVDFSFMHLLYEDFDRHVNLMYDFANQLNDFKNNSMVSGLNNSEGENE